MQNIYSDSINRFNIYDKPGNVLISKKYHIVDESGGFSDGLILVQRFENNLSISFPNGVVVYNQSLFDSDNLKIEIEKDFHNQDQINLLFYFASTGVNGRIVFYQEEIIILD